MSSKSNSDEKCVQKVQAAVDAYGKHRDPDYMTPLSPHLQVVSAAKGPGAGPRSEGVATVTFSYTVQPDHCNRLGNLHGGAIATLFDFCTTMPLALIGKPGFWSMMGVSRNISVVYLRPVPIGQKVYIECDVVAAGARLALIRGTMKRAEDGAVMATCTHDKASIEHLGQSKM